MPKNLDTIEATRIKFGQKMLDATKDDNPEVFAQVFTEFAESLQDVILQKAENLIQTNDATILAQRGVRQLTSEETTYYNKAIDAMRSSNPRQALTELGVVLPKTTIDAVFEDLTTNHPLLNLIDFQNTGALIEIIMSTSDGVAGWGDLCADITDEISGSFSVVDLTLKKLSAFIPVCKAMLDLGPVWLDRYVRTILAEALAVALEAAGVDGDGNGKPIGMTRALSGAVDGVYPRKTPIPVTALDATTIGGILETVSKTPNGNRRVVPRLLMVVNPADYYTKVFPATTVRATNGSFVNDVLPYPMDIVMAAAMPEGKAVFGIANRYFFGLGTSRGGKLEYSDEYRFLEDERVYLIKLYGNGQPKDANAFVYANISGLEPYVLNVNVVNAADIGA